MTNPVEIITDPASRFTWGVSITSAIIGIASIWIFYAAVLDRSPPISDLRGRVSEVFPRPDGSHLMIVEWSGVRQRYCEGVSHRWLVDGIVLPLPDLPTPPQINEKIGDRIKYNIAVEVPAMFHRIGNYTIRTQHQCNLLQRQFPNALSIQIAPDPVPFNLDPDKDAGK